MWRVIMTTNNKTIHIQDNGLSYRPEKETQKVKSFIIVIKDNLTLLFVFIEVFIKKGDLSIWKIN